MKIKEIRNLPLPALTHELQEARKKLDDLRFKAQQKQLKNIREIRVWRTTIAKMMQVCQEKKQETK